MSARLIKGFRFGMLLQLSIGPVCLYVFNAAAKSGFLSGFFAVCAVALIDALFILAAIVGISGLLQKKNAAPVLNVFGAIVLLLFGLYTILGALGVNVPSLRIATAATASSSFVYALLLTASNPLTILFWSGVFSAKVADERMTRGGMLVFGAGAALSTLFFLSLVAAAGSLLSAFLPPLAVTVLNVAVGAVLIGFGIARLLKKAKPIPAAVSARKP